MPIENKYIAITAFLLFLLAVVLTHGSLLAGFGMLALTAGVGWAIRHLRS